MEVMMRCYNGCPDAELQALIDSEQSIRAQALKEGINLTYFPGEEKWGASEVETYKPLGELKTTLHEAYHEGRRCSETR
jgi:hypothetical protein